MYSVLLSIVQSTTPLALRIVSPLKEHGETYLMEDGVEFKQLEVESGRPVGGVGGGIKEAEQGDAWFVVMVA